MTSDPMLDSVQLRAGPAHSIALAVAIRRLRADALVNVATVLADLQQRIDTAAPPAVEVIQPRCGVCGRVVATRSYAGDETPVSVVAEWHPATGNGALADGGCPGTGQPVKGSR